MRPDLDSMRDPARIGEAVEVLGVPISTLRRWEASGRPVAERLGTHRQHDLAEPCPEQFRVSGKVARSTTAYARASSHDREPTWNGISRCSSSTSRASRQQVARDGRIPPAVARAAGRGEGVGRGHVITQMPAAVADGSR